MNKADRERKYGEMVEHPSSKANEIGRRRPAYMDYDSSGRRKEKKENES